MALPRGFESRDTPVHKLCIITKIAVTASFITLAGLYLDPLLLLPLLLFSILWCFLARVPTKWFSINMIITSIFAPFQFLVALLQTNPQLFKVTPPEVSSLELIAVSIPYLGRVKFTYGAAIWMLGGWFRRYTVLLIASTFAYSASMPEITSLLTILHFPTPIVYIFMVCYRYFPMMLRMVGNISSAQKLRGWKAESRKPLKLASELTPFITPLMRRVGQMAEQVAVGAQIRALGARRITPIRPLKMGIGDYLLASCSLLVFIIGVYMLMAHNVGLI